MEGGLSSQQAVKRVYGDVKGTMELIERGGLGNTALQSEGTMWRWEATLALT